MTLEALARLLAAGLAVLLGGVAGASSRLVASLLASVAAFGLLARELPSPGVGAFLAVVLCGLLAAGSISSWPPLTADAARDTALVAVPAVVIAALALRQRPAEAVLGALTVLAGLSFFGGEASRANTEAGWRRAALWAGAVALPGAASAGLLLLAGAAGLERASAAAVVLASLGFLPALLSESARARRELEEEVRLGLLPAEDAAVLRLPWKRALEPRFGRRDERREYVRSALLLAVVRQQQRRRSGEAARLRQLEVLTFRTRIRRVLQARAEREARLAADALD